MRNLIIISQKNTEHINDNDKVNLDTEEAMTVTMNIQPANKMDANTQNIESTEETIEPEPMQNKDDWSSLMFSSDNALFKEWTRQMEDSNNNTESINNKQITTNCTVVAVSTSTLCYQTKNQTQ